MTDRWSAERGFAPAMPAVEREERYVGWQRAVAGALAMTAR
jgi:glycerol kinase